MQTVTLVTMQPISDDMLTTSKSVSLSPSANGPLERQSTVSLVYKRATENNNVRKAQTRILFSRRLATLLPTGVRESPCGKGRVNIF